MNDIVVGIDRSETAAVALDKAASLASALRANLHIVTCVDRSAPVDMHVGSDHFHVDRLGDAAQFLEGAARRVGAADASTVAVGLGDPAAFLCEEADRLRARLIVVGNQRVQSVARVLGAV
ncbi:MAG: universal stress protein, partial [Ilumatobacteraceae bacterium]